jgi:ankyrin repeat protein
MLRKGNYNLVKIFIQMGIVKLLKYDPKKLIPFLPEQLFSELCYYGTNNHILILKELIKNGIDIHMGEEYALRRACLYGHLNIIKELINAGANVKDDNYPYSTSPLSEAIKSGNTLVVKELINAGAEINTKYRNALRLAIDDDNLEMVKFLIDNGADVSIFDQEEINDMSTEMGLYILNIQNKK